MIHDDEILRRLKRVEARAMHGQLPVSWKAASGSTVVDIHDREYIDFTSTIFVQNVGHGHPEVIAAITRTMEKPLLAAYTYPTEIRADYLERLINFAGEGFEKAFLVSSGTEAVEVAIKLMRLYGRSRKKSRYGIVSCKGNWHGRTMGAQMLSSNEAQKTWIGSLDPNMFHMDFPYPWLVAEEDGAVFFEKKINELIESLSLNPSTDLVGFALESFQGWGAFFYPVGFVKALEKFATKHDLLIFFDEMQAGFYRTGMKFGFQHYDVVPDLFACGKAMGGGLPMSGVVGRGDLLDLAEVGSMSSTHSAHPICCAAALAVLDIMEAPSFPDVVARNSNRLWRELHHLQELFPSVIEATYGKGCIAALIIKSNQQKTADQRATEICEKALDSGLLLVKTGRESIKIGPPLTIDEPTLVRGLEILQECLRAFNEAT